MRDPNADSEVVEAIRDLTRVIVALHGDFESRAAAIRALSDLGIRPSSIATIFDIQAKDVSSVISKAKRRAERKGGN